MLTNLAQITGKTFQIWVKVMWGQNQYPFPERLYRFYFLSNEEERIHIHATREEGEAKFWIEPIVSLAVYHGLNPKKLN